MVWNAQFPDLPIPTPGQMNPVNQAFAQALDNYVKQANASAKATYSQLMGPQFMAKALQNENFLANDPRAQQHIQQVTGAAENAMGGRPGGGLLTQLAHMISEVIHGRSATDQGTQPQTQRSVQQQEPSQPSQQKIGGQVEEPATGYGATNEDQMMRAWIESPEAKAQASKEGSYIIPSKAELKRWYDNRQNNTPQAPVQPTQPAPTPAPIQQPQQMQPTQTEQPGQMEQPKSVAENAAEFQRIKAFGRKLGEISGSQVEKLDDQYESALTAKTNLDKLGSILSSPALREMRQLSVGGKYELGYFAANGTPEQKEIVGKLKSGIGNVVVDMAGNFKGAFRVGEQKLIDEVKVNDNDPIDVAIGKWQSAQLLNEVKLQRTRLAANLMISRHLTKGEALDKAKNIIKAEDVERQVEDFVHPKITIRNPETGEIITIRRSDYMQSKNKSGGSNG